MFGSVNSLTMAGLEARPVCVEADISDGLPVFDMVGYLGREVNEAKERVRTALKNCGIHLPPKRITVNISPGDIKKNGTVKTLSSSDYIIIEERMSGVPLIRVDKEERIIIK